MADGEYKADAQDVAEKARHDQMLEEMYRKNSNSELPNNNIDTTPSPVPGLPVGGSSGGSMPPASGDDG
jgi:hypothetical protein